MKNFFKTVLFILIGVFIIFVIYFIYQQFRLIQSGSGVFPFTNPIPQTSKTNNNSVLNSGVQNVVINDQNLNGLDRALKNIRQASLDNNIYLLNQYYSAKTQASFGASGAGRIIKTFLKDVQFSNLKKINNNEVLVTVSQIEMSDHTESQDVIFVKESNGWKMGVVETKAYFGN